MPTLVLVMLLGRAFLFLGIWFLQDAYKTEYPQLVGIIIGGFFSLIGILCVLAGMYTIFFEPQAIIIYYDRIEVRKKGGHRDLVIYNSEITHWKETTATDKVGNKSSLLTIYYERKKITMSDRLYKNYEQIRDHIEATVEQNEAEIEQTQKRERKLAQAIYLVAACLSFWAAWHFYRQQQKIISPTDLVTISDVIVNRGEVTHGKRKKNIHINLASIPDFTFDLSGVWFSATDVQNYLSQVKTGDTLWLDILTDEYNAKITKNTPISFIDKTVNYSFISVYSLRDNQYTYLELSDFNRESQKHAKIGAIVFLALGCAALFGALRDFFKR